MRRLLAFLIFGGAMLPVAHAGWLDFLIPKHDVRVITVTDTTPAGAKLQPATLVSPAYYVAVSAGYREFGGSMAGEKPPPNDDVIKTMAKVLAKQGYLPATKSHPPTLVLLWTWGDMNTDMFYDPSNIDWPPQQLNRSQMLRFLGAYKLGLVSKEPDPFPPVDLMPGLTFMDNDSEAIYDVSTEDLYIIAIGAYDFQAFTHKQRVLLWTTKISCPSLGLALKEVLPAMMTIAGPFVGRETPRPVYINASDKFKPDVQIGEPTLVEYLGTNKLPVIDVTKVPPKSVAKPPPPEAKPAQETKP